DFDVSLAPAAVASLPSATAPAAGQYRGELADCLSIQNVHWPPLPSTGAEVADLAAAWRQAATRDSASAGSATRGSDAAVLTGSAATEEAFRREASGRRIVHLATHGFFLSSSCALMSSGTRGITAIAPAPEPRSGNPSGSPLRLSGL